MLYIYMLRKRLPNNKKVRRRDTETECWTLVSLRSSRRQLASAIIVVLLLLLI